MIPSSQSLDGAQPPATPAQPDDIGIQPSMQPHVIRNPLQPTIPLNQRPAQRVNKVSHHVAGGIRKEQRAELLQDLSKFQDWRSKAIADLAAKHHRKPHDVQVLLTGQTQYKKRRATNLYNAKIAYKCRELKQAGKAPMKLPELRQAVQADSSLQDLTAERKDELLSLLESEKTVKKTGARVSNRAAVLDYNSTVARIEQEIVSLERRTGVKAFAFFSRSHVNDSMKPRWIASANALEFFPQSMKISASEVGRKLELWACNRNS